MTDTHDPYAASRHHVELAVEFLGLSATQAESLRTRHEGAMRYDLDHGLTYTDGSADTATWLRGLEKAEPSLLGKAPAKAPAPTDLTSASFTQLAAASKRGDAAADAELNRRMRHGDGTPVPAVSTAFNLTAAMAKAKAGDAHAQAAIDQYFSRN